MKQAILYTFLALLVSVHVGCARYTILLPAPAARLASLPGEGATAETAGVRVMASGNNWPGMPAVMNHVTPVNVTIENHHGAPLRIRYDEFALVGAGGSRYAALPLYRITGRVAVYVQPYFPARGYYGAPYYSPFYPFFERSGAPPFYGSGYYGYWQDVELPTEAMVEKALKEERLQNGATLSGFLYFEKIPSEAQQIAFRMALVDARTDQVFGTVNIPFEVATK